MAFDVQTSPVTPSATESMNSADDSDTFRADLIKFVSDLQTRIPKRVRRVALFEGRNEFGRIQPILGTVDPATDADGNPINWPNTTEYRNADLVGPMIGALAWHSPTTENIPLGDTEDWEIWDLERGWWEKFNTALFNLRLVISVLLRFHILGL